jgi:predicted component of type VI protein secretion system
MLESETTYWETVGASRGAEADLVEARFHLANAEVFDAAMDDQQKARIELKRAENYLIVDRPSEKNALPGLATIKKEIDAAILDLESINSKNLERYERLKIDLDHVIATLRSQRLSRRADSLFGTSVATGRAV